MKKQRVLLRHRVAHRIGNIQDGGAGVLRCCESVAEKFHVAAAGVLGGKLHFGASLAAVAHHAGDGLQRLSAGDAQFVAQVQVRSGQENVQARLARWLKRLERSEEHTSELQSLAYLVCRLLLEKKKK